MLRVIQFYVCVSLGISLGKSEIYVLSVWPSNEEIISACESRDIGTNIFVEFNFDFPEAGTEHVWASRLDEFCWISST